MKKLITKKMADGARKLLQTYHLQQEAHKRKNGLCLLCGKSIGHIPTEDELCWCSDCFNGAMDAGEDEKGSPTF